MSEQHYRWQRDSYVDREETCPYCYRGRDSYPCRCRWAEQVRVGAHKPIPEVRHDERGRVYCLYGDPCTREMHLTYQGRRYGCDRDEFCTTRYLEEQE